MEYLGRPSKECFQLLDFDSSADSPVSFPSASRRTVALSAAGPTHFFSTGTETLAVEALVTVKPRSASPETLEL